MTPNVKPNGNCTFHRDGSVSFFDILQLRWHREPASVLRLRDDVLATLSDKERARIEKHGR